jgi:HNH endonuclease
MNRHVPRILREEVAKRADFRCEYCRLPEIAALVRFEVEHIISLQHGGKTVLENLAHTCPICNSHKGPNVGTVLGEDFEQFVQFFNPRKHVWDEHFEYQNGKILPKTLIGTGTAKILKFNKLERILERQVLADAGWYP